MAGEKTNQLIGLDGLKRDAQSEENLNLVFKEIFLSKAGKEILAYLRAVNVKSYVHKASSAKSLDWYIKAWKANTSATWIFGIDGLPNESHKYRVNQDGEKLFKIMCESKKYLNTRSVWQYIIFNYNEDHLEEAKKMADEHDLFFIQKQSSRWLSHDDPYMPSKKYKLGWRHG